MRRLETGDWVLLAGDDPSLRGVGKVIDGQFAAEDDALLSAQVEVGARAVWLHPSDLVRVDPADEARLCEAALTRGLVPAEHRTRLEGALAAFRAGQAFVRTPGLVDRLWALSSHADPDEGSPALATFLVEEAAAALRVAAAAPADEPPGPVRADAPVAPPSTVVGLLAPLDREALLEVAARCGVDLGPAPGTLTALQVQRAIVAAGVGAWEVRSALEPPARPTPRAPGGAREVLALILAGLNKRVLIDLGQAAAVDLGPQPARLPVDRLRDALQADTPPLTDVLAHLTPNQLRGACERLKLDPLGDAPALRARIEALASDL
ncbi:MAG: hypothetical protein KF878_06155 [Planctomycetes bacterium]|nr:hypothetical protein [Planctomycetota bacterium]